MSSDIDEFEKNNEQKISDMVSDKEYCDISKKWFEKSIEHEYHYHFNWLGVPIIQFPQDILITQELVWNVKPDVILETGIARGGSLIFYSSLMQMLGNGGKVIGIDIDIREHNRNVIESHPMSKNIEMITGSSIDDSIFQKAKELIGPDKKVLVILDSNHTADHVSKELDLYSQLVSKDSYMIVFDTVIEDLPDKFNANRSWGKGNSPKNSVHKFLEENKNFTLDKKIENKALMSVAPDGFLKRIN
jgi:cephalosporin hydroxylase